ncbi:MAG: hypothetical protein KDN20_04435 [Verrucomicrobiae bacterium]|nr:hypothetical protein [Verrucomicrobiae bacterium]
MIDWIKSLPAFVWVEGHPALVGWLAAASVLTLILSAILVPVIVSRMRADYFMSDRDPERMFASQHPVIRWIGLILKNIFGIILFLVGIVMLATPGQGILTVFVGFMLIDFPGKRKLELFLIRFSVIHRAIDWIRKKAGRQPLQLPEK